MIIGKNIYKRFQKKYLLSALAILLLELALISAYSTASAAVKPNLSTYNYYLPFLANNFQPAGSSGQYSTSLTIQNAGSGAVTFQKQYYDTNGNPTTSGNVTLQVGAQWNDLTTVPSGSQGTGVISSNQPLNVLIVETTPFGGSAYPVSPGTSSSLVAPLAINNALGGFSTRLTILNTGDSSTTASVVFYDVSGANYKSATKNVSIAPHSSVLLDQSSSDSNLPAGFYGWAQIIGASGSQLVAQILEQRPSTKFTALVNANASVSSSLYAPAIFHNSFGNFSTGANIVNPNSSSVTLNITYYDSNGTSYNSNPVSVAPFAMVPIYHGANSGGVGLPSNGLPNQFYGTATVTSQGGGVVMVVNEAGNTTPNGAAQSGTYTAATGGSNVIGLPIITRNGNPGFGGALMTGATIMNSSVQAVSGKVQYYNADGSLQGNAIPFTVGAKASFAFYQGDNGQNLPDGFTGSATITEIGSGNDLIVTTNAQSASFFYTYTEPSNPNLGSNLPPVPTVTGTVTPTPTLPGNLDTEEAAFLTLINQYRQANGLGTLSINVNLTNSSKWMSNDMATKNYFSHTDSLGRDPTQRAAAFGYSGGVGENIAGGFSTAQLVFNAWKNSPGHNANMLNAGYKTIGIGRVYNASSTYQTYWTTDFGG